MLLYVLLHDGGRFGAADTFQSYLAYPGAPRVVTNSPGHRALVSACMGAGARASQEIWSRGKSMSWTSKWKAFFFAH
jgi:hypothetical protein